MFACASDGECGLALGDWCAYASVLEIVGDHQGKRRVSDAERCS